jgi:hypothetical protein
MTSDEEVDDMHSHDFETLKRRAAQARELAEMVEEPRTINRLLGAAAGYELEAEVLAEARAMADRRYDVSLCDRA